MLYLQQKNRIMLPVYCPSCHAQLKVKCLKCESCQTEVNGSYDLPLLSQDDQQFILQFVKNSGSLKNMANELKLSYPTVRNLLNDIILTIEKYEK